MRKSVVRQNGFVYKIRVQRTMRQGLRVHAVLRLVDVRVRMRNRLESCLLPLVEDANLVSRGSDRPVLDRNQMR
jgi:hypothetical protein